VTFCASVYILTLLFNKSEVLELHYLVF